MQIDVPLSQLRLLKRRARGGAAQEVDLEAVDVVYQEISGKLNAPVQAPQKEEKEREHPPLPTIPFLCVMQYSSEESEQMSRTVLDLADSLLTTASTMEPSSIAEPALAGVESKHLLDVELEQRETLENLSYWRQNLMSSVLPASKRGLEGQER
jgi:hypothetical protein